VKVRGKQGRAILVDDQDRRRLLDTLAEAGGKTGGRIDADAILSGSPEANWWRAVPNKWKVKSLISLW
jgi:hypothetical protein